MTSWAAEFDSGDICWLLIMAVLPAILVVSGTVSVLKTRVANDVVEPFLQRLPLLVASILIAWGLWVYSLAFGPSWGTMPDPNAASNVAMSSLNELLETDEIHVDKSAQYGRGGFIGGIELMALDNVIPVASTKGPHFPVRRPHKHVPHILECLFRWTSLFIALVPLWIVWSRSLNGVSVGILGLLWSTFVYAPIAHWLWGDGWLEKLGAIDFGGALIIIAVAVSALASSVRSSGADTASKSEDLGVGTILVLAGTATFVAAQGFHADGRAALVLFNVLLGTSTGILVWSGANGFVWKVDNLDSVGTGLIACAAGLAGPAGFIQPQSAIIIGAFIGFLTNGWLRFRSRGSRPTGELFTTTMLVAASAGMLSAGVFATSSAAGIRWDGRPITGLIEGNTNQFMHQLIAIVSTLALAYCTTWLLCAMVRSVQRTVDRKRFGTASQQSG